MHHPINLPVQFEPVMTFARMPQPARPEPAVSPDEDLLAACIALATAYEARHLDDGSEMEAMRLRFRAILRANGVEPDSFVGGVA